MERHERLVAATVGLFCSVVMVHTTQAHAEEASATETAAARALAVEGLKLAQAGNCAEAAPKLERAEKLYHSPVVASRLGECYVSLGKLVEGTEILRKVLREPQSAEVTPALTKALERAQHTLDAAKPRIAGLTLKVSVVEGMQLKIDGNEVPVALVDTEIPSDPGEHVIEVTAPGFLRAQARTTVAEGEKKNVALTLSRDPNAPLATAPSATAAEPAPVEKKVAPRTSDPASVGTEAAPVRQSPNHTAAYVAYGVGAVGVVTGSVLGLMTMGRHKDLEQKCPDNNCSADQRDSLDSAKTLGNFSNVAFGVGAAGLVLGTVLYFTVGGSDSDHARLAEKPRFAGLSSPRIALSPTRVELSARF